MTHQGAGSAVNPHDVVNVCPFMTNLSSSTFALMVSAHDVIDDSAMNPSRKGQQVLCLLVLISRVLYGSSTTGLCTFEASRLFLGSTITIGTDGFRVEGRYLLSLRCLCRWIGTLVLGICAMGWIRDDPERQHKYARALRACIWAGLDEWPPVRTLLPWHSLAVFVSISGTRLSSFVLSIEMLNLTQALLVTRKRHQLTCRPHPLDLAAKDPSHSMKSSIIAWPSKRSVFAS